MTDLFAPRPSAQQEAIYDFVARGTGHGIVRARAGTGKTTTIVGAVARAPRGARVLVCAFNKRIADELAPRVARLGRRGAEVCTLHSLGNRAVGRAWGRACVMDTRRGLRLAAASLPPQYQRAARELVDVIALCKARLAIDEAEVERAVRTAELGSVPPSVAVDAAQRAMAAALERDSGVDFDDMVFVPAAHGWRTGAYDLVFVDETQDMSAAQLVLAQNALAPQGRMVLVGDDRQAIYSWRGADVDGIDRMRAELDATELPLSVTYRCGRSIVAEAARVVRDYSSPPGTHEGALRACRADTARWVPGDAVLSRINAPLVQLALAALRDGVPARIEGRDIASGLKKWVHSLGSSDVPSLLARARDWRDRELASLGADDDERGVELRDRYETLCALAEGMASTNEVLQRLDALFSDEGDAVVFSSVHRAKGLEWDRVWLLAESFRPSASLEQENLWYVALTRARHELVLVVGACRGKLDASVAAAVERTQPKREAA